MTVLQRLLESELIEIDDDPQMEKLLAAAALVQKQLTDGSLDLARATLVAMDPQVTADDPILDAVYTMVAGEWATIKRRYPDRPVALLRGVLAQALSSAGATDIPASVIWPTASSYAPYAPLAREQEVWGEILSPISDRAERAAATEWSGVGNSSSVPLPTPEIPAISAPVKGVNVATLKAHLAAAAGPVEAPEGVTSNSNGVVNDGYSRTAQPAWANTFAATAAAGIALAVNNALQSTAKGIDVAPLANALAAHTAQLGEAVGKALAPLHAIALRSRTLFWRQALYSSSRRQSYREMTPELAMVAIAADLAGDVPPMCPSSVDQLVWEAAHAVVGNRSTTINGFADAIAGHNRSTASSLLGEGVVTAGRKTLLSFLRAVADSGEVPSGVRAELGVDTEVEVQLADLTRWLFRDLRAERIAADAAPRRRARRK